MSSATDEVIATSLAKNIDLRTSAYVNAINKIHEFYSISGLTNWYVCHFPHNYIWYSRSIDISIIWSSGSSRALASLDQALAGRGCQSESPPSRFWSWRCPDPGRDWTSYIDMNMFFISTLILWFKDTSKLFQSWAWMVPPSEIHPLWATFIMAVQLRYQKTQICKWKYLIIFVNHQKRLKLHQMTRYQWRHNRRSSKQPTVQDIFRLSKLFNILILLISKSISAKWRLLDKFYFKLN